MGSFSDAAFTSRFFPVVSSFSVRIAALWKWLQALRIFIFLIVPRHSNVLSSRNILNKVITKSSREHSGNVAFNNFLSSHVSICKVNESYIPFCVNCAIILNEKVHCQICFGYGQSRDASRGILHDLSHESERCYLRRLY